MADEGIKFQAEVASVRTLADGAPRITLDLPEYEIGKAALIMGLHRETIEVTIKRVSSSLTNGESETDQRAAIATPELAGG